MYANGNVTQRKNHRLVNFCQMIRKFEYLEPDQNFKNLALCI